jgi:hypothetical protein
MIRIALLSACTAVAALVAAGTTSAKEISSVQVCGPQACATVTDRDTISSFENSAGSGALDTGPAAPGAYYVLRVTVDTGQDKVAWEQYYVPSARKVRDTSAESSSLWHRPSSAERAFLDSLAAGVQPYAVPEITSATVGRKAASNPGSYLNLYRLKATPRAYPRHSGWRRIRLHSAAPSPWTDGVSILRYLPKERLLDRDNQYVRLTKRLGRALQRAAALQVG